MMMGCDVMMRSDGVMLCDVVGWCLIMSCDVMMSCYVVGWGGVG